MDAIPLIKAKSLGSYVGLLRKIGAPVESGLQRARLPTLFEESPDAWISFARMISFLDDMAAREALPDLGLLLGTEAVEQNLIPAITNPLRHAPTLLDALQKLPSISSRQNSQLKTWIEPHGEMLRLCVFLPVSRDTPGHQISEARSLDLVKMVVRSFVGAHFEPARVLLASRARDLKFDVEIGYRGVPVLTDQPYGAIEIPREYLCATQPSANGPCVVSSVSDSGSALPTSFAQSLEACLQPYLFEGYPSVNLAAEIMGCNVRALQRRLAEEGTSYRGVLEKVRCLCAMSYLCDSEVNIAELALKLGYAEHSAFTRAFRRWTGTSPSEYRDRLTHTLPERASFA